MGSTVDGFKKFTNARKFETFHLKLLKITNKNRKINWLE